MAEPRAGAGRAGRDTPEHGTLLSVAPAAADLPHLLRTAIDAEQVGAARIHLAADQQGLADAVTAIRAHTHLVITADPAAPDANLADRPGAEFTELVLPASLSGPDLLIELSRLTRERRGPVSVAGHDDAALPVLLAALAVGLHVRVGTADLSAQPDPNLNPNPNSPGVHGESGADMSADRTLPRPIPRAGPPPRSGGVAGPRDDIGLIARAAGLARIAGRPAMPIRQARAVLGVPGTPSPPRGP